MRQSERPAADEFDATVTRETRRLYALALSILRDDGEAEDAVQETLIRAWRAWPSLDHTVSPEPWLVRVCVNQCISRRRHLTRRGWYRRAELRDDASAASGDHASAVSLDIDRAYRRLSVRQRAALTLNYRHGYSVDECAVLMRCRPGTVRAHLARALASLRKELRDE